MRFSVTSDQLRRMSWTTIANVGVIGMAAYGADFDHYTWWSQATFTTFAILGVIGLETQYFFFFQARRAGCRHTLHRISITIRHLFPARSLCSCRSLPVCS